MIDESLAVAFAALRAQVGALQAQIDGLERLVRLTQPAPGTPEPCSHPDTEDAGSTLGHARRRCTRCREIVEP